MGFRGLGLRAHPIFVWQVGCIAVAASALVLAFAFEKEAVAQWHIILVGLLKFIIALLLFFRHVGKLVFVFL